MINKNVFIKKSFCYKRSENCPLNLSYMVRRCSDMYSSDEEGNEEDNKEHADNMYD